MSGVKVLKSRLTINNIYSDWASGSGAFAQLYKVAGDKLTMWNSDNYDSFEPSIMDIEYHSEHGDVIGAPLILKLLSEDAGLSDTQKQNIAKITLMRYRDKWNRLFSLILKSEYNPIENYNRVETSTTTKTGSETDSGTNSNTRTRTPNLTSGDAHTGTDTTTEHIDESNTQSGTHTQKFTDKLDYTDGPGASGMTETTKKMAFGGDANTEVITTAGTNAHTVDGTNNTQETTDTYTNYKNTKQTGTDGNKTTLAHGETITHTESGTETTTDSGNTGNTHTYNGVQDSYTNTTSGNIGVTTTQQMMTQEYDFRKLVDYLITVYKDMDSIIGSGIYPDMCGHEMWTIYEPGKSSAVTSVNGKTGDVVLDIPEKYVLPRASATALGGVILEELPESVTYSKVAYTNALGEVMVPVDDVIANTEQIEALETAHELLSGKVTAVETELPNKYSATNPPPYPVTSVNGQTGDVTVEAGGGWSDWQTINCVSGDQFEFQVSVPETAKELEVFWNGVAFSTSSYYLSSTLYTDSTASYSSLLGYVTSNLKANVLQANYFHIDLDTKLSVYIVDRTESSDYSYGSYSAIKEKYLYRLTGLNGIYFLVGTSTQTSAKLVNDITVKYRYK